MGSRTTLVVQYVCHPVRYIVTISQHPQVSRGRAMDVDQDAPSPGRSASPTAPDPPGGSEDKPFPINRTPPPLPSSRPPSPASLPQEQEQRPLFPIPGGQPAPRPPPHREPVPEDEDVEEGYAEARDNPVQSNIEDIQITNDFIAGLRSATLASSGLDNDTLYRMSHPRQQLPPMDALQRAGTRMFLARGDSSQDNYMDNRAAMMELHPEDEIPTYWQAQKLASSYTGIDAVRTDMCVNSCVAYTGPFTEYADCPECGEPRYDPWQEVRSRKVARRTFSTFPIGPQLQTLYASPDTATLMRHRATRTDTIRQQIVLHGHQSITHFDDIYYANDYLALVNNNTIKADDIVLMFSLDGAQLYQNKGSDCWFFVWVLFDLPPTHRYKKQFVLPGGVISGPKKPKNIESFLYPSLYHLAALQRQGLQIWDAARQIQIRSDPFLYLATADAPGMALLNGLVGHTGRCGCRVYCGQHGYHKPSKPIYYPALLLPDVADDDARARLAGPSSSESDGEQGQGGVQRRGKDQSVHNLSLDSTADIARYARNLLKVESSGSENQYARRRLRTGIARPTIMSGLSRAQKPPRGFGLDLMHLISLNLTDLVISLLRGTLVCEEPDNKATWDFAVFHNAKKTWKDHGALVADATRFLPSSFDRPPRNPTLKISSGYKAWEFLLYVYGLLPGLLRTLQAPVYYRHFCKLVLGVRLLLQRSLPRNILPMAQQCIVEYVEEFEKLYYQRRMDRLHFVRPCLHTLAHIVGEIERTSLCSLYTQWTLENFIGNITREIRQHVTPYANVSERALRRCQVNALRSMIPAFALPEPTARHSLDLGDNYILLSPYESTPELVGTLEVLAMHDLYRRSGIQVDPTDHPIVSRWARLRLPTGQNARTAWKEKALEQRFKSPRRARMAKVCGLAGYMR